MIFLPLPVLVTGGHISETPFTYCDVTYFIILHLETIKLKQQKCDVIQCPTSSTPSAPLTCDEIYGCPLIKQTFIMENKYKKKKLNTHQTLSETPEVL